MNNKFEIKKIIAMSLALITTASLFGCASQEAESVDGTIIAGSSAIDPEQATDISVSDDQLIQTTLTEAITSSITNESSVTTTETVSAANSAAVSDIDENSVTESYKAADSELTTLFSEETTDLTTESTTDSTMISSETDADTAASSSEISEEGIYDYFDEQIDSDDFGSEQKNAINMVNYLSVLNQEINDSKDNRIFLESVYSSLINNTYPNAIDDQTQAKISSILDTLENYRMISVKRERLEYIYEQNKAQAFRDSIPDPVALLSAVKSDNALKAAVSVLYLTVDASTKYSTASRSADMQYLQSGWELDDDEAKELHNSRKGLFEYMVSMVNNYNLSGDLALSEEYVNKFVEWKNNNNTVSRISWLESNQKTYKQFGPYWLELARSYYNNDQFENCLEAIDRYEAMNSRIFRRDYEYADTLPMVIIAAKEVLNEDDYIEAAQKYANDILTNSNETDWELRYFVAQVYVDLYTITRDTAYLKNAYDIVYDNVNILVKEQHDLNDKYLADVEENTVTIEKPSNNNGETKKAYERKKKEAKEYNNMLKKRRETELPPVSEPLYLNCDLLFALADEINISSTEKSKIDSILHENGDSIFLTKPLDDKFWFNNNNSEINIDEMTVDFDGGSVSIPASCVSDNSEISVKVSGANEEITLTDWKISEVKRKKNDDFSDFVAVYTNKGGKDYKYKAGQKVTITVTPIKKNSDDTLVDEHSDDTIEIVYNVVSKKILGFINHLDFERE